MRWVCRDKKANAFQAAEQFARERERTIGEWKGDRFQFDDGVKWYRIRLDKDGWVINQE